MVNIITKNITKLYRQNVEEKKEKTHREERISEKK